MTDVDYANVRIPPEKSPAEFSYVERRKQLLDIIHARGSPHALNQTELAQQFDVSPSQISQDLDRLAEYVSGELGAHRDLLADSLYRRCIEGLLDREDWRGAAQVQTQYEEWLDRLLSDPDGTDTDADADDAPDVDAMQESYPEAKIVTEAEVDDTQSPPRDRDGDHDGHRDGDRDRAESGRGD